jgi:hypothetical protein
MSIRTVTHGTPRLTLPDEISNISKVFFSPSTGVMDVVQIFAIEFYSDKIYCRFLTH